MKTPCVLFDFDGTLFDSIPIAYRATRLVFEASGCTPPEFEEYFLHCHAPFDVFYRSRGVSFSEEEIWRHFSRAADFSTAVFFSDVSPILSHLFLHGCTLGIVSGQKMGTLRHACEAHNLSHFFSVGIRGEVNDKVAALKEVCETHLLSREHTWYVGDFPADMRDAKTAGVHAVGIMRGNNTEKALRTAGAEYCVNTLYEFTSLLLITGGD